jgi:GntR family transcriptional regulator/MocR family aminotransferase
MRIPLNRDSKLSLYQQIEQYLIEKINSFALPPGTKLPSTRELAFDLGVNRITVANAYAELEAQGLVYTRLGSGTYVSMPPDAHRKQRQDEEATTNWPLWQKAISRQSVLPTELERSRIGMQHSSTELVQENDGLISFAGGHGAVELFPADDFRKALQTVLLRDKTDALGYGDYAGYPPLRGTIAHILSNQGINTHPNNVLITTGSQQAFALVAGLLLRSGDIVLVENPTYATAIDLINSLGAQLIGVPMDDQGIRVDLMEDLLRTVHPKLIYTIPSFQNPTGACLSGARRRQMVALAERYNVPILEDEFVGDLRYDGRAQPALKALDPGGYVIYTGTFSKMLMPGLRVGYLVANGPVYDRLLAWKHITDLATSNLMQRALEAYITVGRYEAHLHRARRTYRIRRDSMIAALSRYLPPGASWSTPQGGLFLWLRLPEGLTIQSLYPVALEQKVDFTPGSLFYPEEKTYDHIRLNFVVHNPEVTEEGIRRLGIAMEKCMKAKQV